MEKRVCKILVYRAGGNTGRNTKKYGISLPSKWMKEMGITPEERDVQISFDGSSVVIRKTDGQEPREAYSGQTESGDDAMGLP